MELISILAVMWLVKILFTDGAYAVRGETPPRTKERIAAIQAGQPRRYGLGDYLKDLWHDAVEDARKHREKKRAQAVGTAPTTYTDPQPTGRPQPVPGVPAPPAVFGDDAPIPPTLPAENAELYQQYLDLLDQTGERDGWDQRMTAMSEQERRAYWARIASMGPSDLTDELNKNLNEAREAARQRQEYRDNPPISGAAANAAARPDSDTATNPALAAAQTTGQRPLAAVVPIRSDQKENPTVTTPTDQQSPVANGANMEGGLTSAIAFATQQAASLAGNAAQVEQWIAGLQARGGVSGPAIEQARLGAEKQKEAAAFWTSCAGTLGGHTQVREAYQGNQGAGSREFVTSD